MDRVFHRVMLNYQKENNIKRNCITNAQYLYDQINKNCKHKVKARAVFVINEEKKLFCQGHLVLEYEDGTFIDPSYEYASLNNSKYFTTIHDLHLKESDINYKKELIKIFIKFINHANEINQGEFLINDKKYYDDQADYVENFFKDLPSIFHLLL